MRPRACSLPLWPWTSTQHPYSSLPPTKTLSMQRLSRPSSYDASCLIYCLCHYFPLPLSLLSRSQSEFAYDVLVAVRSMLTRIFAQLSPVDTATVDAKFIRVDAKPEIRALHAYLIDLRTAFYEEDLANRKWSYDYGPVVCCIAPERAAALVKRTRQFLSELVMGLPANPEPGFVPPAITALSAEPLISICTENCPLRSILRTNGRRSMLNGHNPYATPVGTKPLCLAGIAPCNICLSVPWIGVRACNWCDNCTSAIHRDEEPDAALCRRPMHGGLWSNSEFSAWTRKLDPDSNPNDRYLMSEMVSMAKLAKRASLMATRRGIKRQRSADEEEADADRLLRRGTYGRRTATDAKSDEKKDADELAYCQHTFGAHGTFHSIRDRARVMGTTDLISDPDKKYGAEMHEVMTNPMSRCGSRLAAAIVSGREEFVRSIDNGTDLKAEDWIRIDTALFDGMAADRDTANKLENKINAGWKNPLAVPICVRWEEAVQSALASLQGDLGDLQTSKDYIDDVNGHGKPLLPGYDDDVKMGDPAEVDWAKRVKERKEDEAKLVTASSESVVSFIDAVGPDATKIVRRDTTAYQVRLRIAHDRVLNRMPLDDPDVIVLEPFKRSEAVASRKDQIVASSVLSSRDRGWLKLYARTGQTENFVLTSRGEEILASESMSLISSELSTCNELVLLAASAADSLNSGAQRAISDVILPIIGAYLKPLSALEQDRLVSPPAEEDGIVWDIDKEKYKMDPLLEAHVCTCLRGRLYFNYTERDTTRDNGRSAAIQIELVCRVAAGLMARVEDVAGRIFNQFLIDTGVDRTASTGVVPIVSHINARSSSTLAALCLRLAGVSAPPHEKVATVSKLCFGSSTAFPATPVVPTRTDCLGISVRRIEDLKELRRSFSVAFCAVMTRSVIRKIRQDKNPVSWGVMGIQHGDIPARRTVYNMFDHEISHIAGAVDAEAEEREVDVFSMPAYFRFAYQFLFPSIKYAFFDALGVSLPLCIISEWWPETCAPRADVSTMRGRRDSQDVLYDMASNLDGITPLRDRSRVVPVEQWMSPIKGDGGLDAIPLAKDAVARDIVGAVRLWECAALEMMTLTPGHNLAQGLISEFKGCAEWAADTAVCVLLSDPAWVKLSEIDLVSDDHRSRKGVVSLRDSKRIRSLVAVIQDLARIIALFSSTALRVAMTTCYGHSSACEEACRTSIHRFGESHVTPITIIPALFKRSRLGDVGVGSREPVHAIARGGEKPVKNFDARYNNIAYTVILSEALARSNGVLVGYAAARSCLPAQADDPNGPFKIYSTRPLNEQKDDIKRGRAFTNPLMDVSKGRTHGILDNLVLFCIYPILLRSSSNGGGGNGGGARSIKPRDTALSVALTALNSLDDQRRFNRSDRVRVRLYIAFSLSLIPSTFKRWIGWLRTYIPSPDIKLISHALACSITNRLQ
jgi:hypothetical protein